MATILRDGVGSHRPYENRTAEKEVRLSSAEVCGNIALDQSGGGAMVKAESGPAGEVTG